MKLLFSLLVLFSFSLSAETLRTNPDHSEILFQIPYLKLSDVTGRFKKFSGALELSEKGMPQRLEFQIQANSLDTGNKLRDSHLRGQDFLATQDHPLIRFESQKITSSKSQFFASGTLTFLGKSHPLEVFFDLSEVVTDTWSKKSRFAKFDFSLSRKKLGLDWNKTLPGEDFLLGDKIRVWGSLQLQPGGAMTHPTKHMIPDTPYAREREKILRGEKTESEFSSSTGKTLEVPKTPSVKEMTTKVSGSSFQEDPRGRALWWFAFGVLGLMGFFSTIIIGIAFKKWLHKRTIKNHSETSPLGLLSDLVIILVVFIYAVSLWEVGWG